MALALVILGFQLVMGLRAATLRDVLLVRLPSPWMHSASPPVLHEKAVGRKASADAAFCSAQCVTPNDLEKPGAWGQVSRHTEVNI